MKPFRTLIFAAVFSAFGSLHVSAQRAFEAAAFIQNPAGVHYIVEENPSRPGAGSFTYVNVNNGDFDIITVSIGDDGRFQGTSSVTSRSVIGQFFADSTTVTFLGATRTGPNEPTYGPVSNLAGRYYGNFDGATLGAGALQGFVSATGKFLAYSASGDSFDVNIGTMSADGDFFVRSVLGPTGAGNLAITNGTGSGTVQYSNGVSQTFFLAKAVPARLANIATRGRVTNDSETLIGGLIVSEGRKGVLIVARGPSLGAAGVPNPVQNPKVELYLGDQLIASNNNWRENGNASEIAASGAAPSDDREAALQLTLEPNSYTVIVSSETGVPGTGIVEVYGVGGPLGR